MKKEEPHLTGLSSTDWKLAAGQELKSAWSSWKDPRWFEYIDHILNHEETEKAVWMVFKASPDATVYTILRCLDIAIMWRFASLQTNEEKEKERDEAKEHRNDAIKRARRAARILEAIEQIEGDLKREKIMFGALFEMPEWRRLWDRYFGDSQFEGFGTHHRLSTKKAIKEIAADLERESGITGEDMAMILSHLMNAAKPENTPDFSPERIYIELSPGRNRPRD